MPHFSPSLPERPPPRLATLRARLVASHAAVILLALLLVLLAGGPALRRYERNAERDRLGDLAAPLTVEANLLLRGDGALARQTLSTLLTRQAAEMGVRLFVLDSTGVVRFDSERSERLDGQTLVAYVRPIAAVHAAAQGNRRVHRRDAIPLIDTPNPLAGSRVVVAARGPEPQAVLGIAAPAPARPLVGRFVRVLLLALLLALAVAALAGYLLSRRIAAPVARLTSAADAMAAGNLDQRVPGEGSDELGRLVAAFNAMSGRVAATARLQREFLATVAHELRTPLTSVLGYARALRDGVADAPADRDRALATISAEADRMTALIHQLLDLARLESGQTVLALQPVLARAALDDLSQRFAPDAAARHITLMTDAPPDLRLHADPDRLAQILANLVTNALRHTPAGGTVSVTAAPHPTHGATARLIIHDTGEGIPPDLLPSIFDRFTRAPDALPTTGVGLGLPIARELVHAHGGTITVASSPTVGTTFTIDLPTIPTAPPPS